MRLRPQAIKTAAYALAAANGLLATALILLLILNGEPLVTALSYLSELPPSFSFTIVGVLIISRRPDHLLGWIVLLIGLPLTFEQVGDQYALYALRTVPNSLPGGALAGWVAYGLWGLSYGGLTLLVLLFPTGRFLSRRWAWVGALALGGALLWSAHTYASTWNYRGPLLLQDYQPQLAGAYRVSQAILSLITLAFLAATVSAILRLRQSSGVERQQLKWFVYAATLAVSLMLLLYASVLLPGELLKNVAGPFVYAAAFSAIPVGIGIAILRYRLWDIDLIINRTLVYSALTAIIVGLYALTIGGLSALFQTRGSFLVSLIATALVTLLFAPLRDWLQRGVNRLVYGQRDEPYAVLARLGQRLETTLAPDAVLPTIVAAVKEALNLPYVAIALDQDGRCATVAAAGTLAPSPLALQLTYQAEPIGQLILAPRSPGETFSPADLRLLNDLARQVGVAVHAARLTTDLQRSRERLVTAREEERRRLRRDLHDGLGPALAAHTLKIGSARALLKRNPAAADALLAELETNIQASLADIRRLVYNLRPPALDQLGLLAAIRDSAAHYGWLGDGQQNGGDAGRLHIELVAAEPMPSLPAAVEVAAYRIVQEALTNVVRHARATTCQIHVTLDDALRLEIIDNGQGLLPERPAGVGLASMRERAQELGGSCQVEAGLAGGVRVTARLPLPRRLPD